MKKMRSSFKGVKHGQAFMETGFQLLYWILYVKMRSSSKGVKHGQAFMETGFQLLYWI